MVKCGTGSQEIFTNTLPPPSSLPLLPFQAHSSPFVGRSLQSEPAGLTKVEVARPALLDDLVKVPVRRQSVFIMPPEFLIRGHYEAPPPFVVLLKRKHPARCSFVE